MAHFLRGLGLQGGQTDRQDRLQQQFLCTHRADVGLDWVGKHAGNPWASKGKDELQGIYNKPEAALTVQLCVWSDSKIWQLHKCSYLLCSFLKFLVSLHFPFRL